MDGRRAVCCVDVRRRLVRYQAGIERAGAGGRFNSQLLEWPAATSQCGKTGRIRMKNPLDSLWGTIISGLVLTAILYVIVKNFLT